MVSAITMALIISLVPAGISQINGETIMGDILPEPNLSVGGDLIVSYDSPGDANDALHPAVAAAPIGSPNENTIHVVWDEFDDASGFREIHYSMSEDGGVTWNHDLDDFTISDVRKTNAGDAVNPTIAIDHNGLIHVVWSEQMAVDGTWEVMYRFSDDNGKNWLGNGLDDMMISHQYGDRQDADIMSTPEIKVGLTGGKASEILHVVWSERDDKSTQEEVRYSRSLDSGESWSGFKVDGYISDPESGFASDPSITISGVESKIVHVTWKQAGPFGFDEIWYSRSDSFGDNGTWTQEKIISVAQDDGMDVTDVSMCGNIDGILFSAWKQYPREQGKASATEICYSFSDTNGESWSDVEFPISFNDGYEPNAPKISMSDKIVQVVWTEIDEKSPMETMEIHTSWTEDWFNPGSWTGLNEDRVLSNGDDWGPANANNVSFEYANFNGEWKPLFVWDEMNDGPTGKGLNRAEHNNEIHTEPVEWTLSVSTSGSGSVAKDPNQPTYQDMDVVTITANPSTGWSFDHWGGDLSGSTNPETITMESDKSVTAYFTEDQYTLTVSMEGNGNVSNNPDLATYTYGTVVELTANPDFGWEFDHWEGAISSTNNPDNVTMNGRRTVTCNFTQITHNIALTTGWNLVSIPLEQANTSISTVLSSISGNYYAVKYFDATEQDDPWKTYRFGTITNDLEDIDHTMAFWVDIKAPCTFSPTGEYAASTSINLYTGWNFVGYPTANKTTTVTQALTGTSYDMIYGYDAGDPYLLGSLARTDTMLPGAGYWVHVPSDTVWTVNW